MAEAPPGTSALGEAWRRALIESLLRRAEAAGGPLGEDLKQRAERHRLALAAPTTSPPAASAPVRPGRLALAALLRHAAAATAGGAPRESAPAPLAPVMPAELKALRQFRQSWSRLRLDEQLAHSLAALPDKAGPLNSERLALRSLQRLRELSPGYLARLVSQVEALQALGQLGGGRVEAEKARKTRR